MRFLEAAVNIDPNRAEYHLYVGWAANEAGNAGRAEVELKKALDLNHGPSATPTGSAACSSRRRARASAPCKTCKPPSRSASRFEAYATMALCFQDLLKWPEAEGASNGAVAEWHYRLAKKSSSATADLPRRCCPRARRHHLGRGRARQAGLAPDAHFLPSARPCAPATRRRPSSTTAPSSSYWSKEHPYAVDAKRALVGLGARSPGAP